MRIVHRRSMERRALGRRTFPAPWKGPAIAFAVVEPVIDVPVEMFGPVIIRTRADENSTREPLRPVIAVGRAVIRRSLVIPVRANRRSNSNAHRNVRPAAGRHHYSRTDYRGEANRQQIQSLQTTLLE